MKQASDLRDMKNGEIIKAADCYLIAEDVVKKMIYQTWETYHRLLSDHGVRHIIKGNIASSVEMMKAYNGNFEKKIDQQMTAVDFAKMMTIHFNHDVGYAAEINRVGRDAAGDHASFSKKIFENQSELYGKLFDQNELDEMSHVIGTHDQTKLSFDNKKNSLISIVRLSDHLGLFYNEKLPELLYREPENVAILQKIFLAKSNGRSKEIISKLKERLIENIKGKGNAATTDAEVEALIKSVKEINHKTPDYNLGMLAGRIEGYEMREEGHLIVKLSQSDIYRHLYKIFNLHTKQFIKLLKSYKIDYHLLDLMDPEKSRLIRKKNKTQGKNEPISFELLGNDNMPIVVFEIHPDGPENNPDDDIFEEQITTINTEWGKINIQNMLNDFVVSAKEILGADGFQARLSKLTNELLINVRSRGEAVIEKDEIEMLQKMCLDLVGHTKDMSENELVAKLKEISEFMTKKEEKFFYN